MEKNFLEFFENPEKRPELLVMVESTQQFIISFPGRRRQRFWRCDVDAAAAATCQFLPPEAAPAKPADCPPAERGRPDAGTLQAGKRLPAGQHPPLGSLAGTSGHF